MQMPEKKKNKKKRKLHRNRNRNSVRITVFVFFLVHFAFYLTGFIVDSGKYSASDFRVSQPLSDYKTVALIRWDYAPEERTMELVFDLENTVYSEGNTEFQAVYDNSKVIDSQIVYSTQDMLIIQLYHIPEKTGKKVTVTFEYTPDGEKTSSASFYSYTGIMNEVESLPVLSQDEYYLSRQDYDIAYYQDLIDGLQKKISGQEASIENIQQDIERLQGKDANLTTDELLNLNSTLENDRETIAGLEEQIEKNKNMITEYQEIIAVLWQRKEDYERTD